MKVSRMLMCHAVQEWDVMGHDTDYAERAREIREKFGGDRELAHIKLDELLCEALEEHGEEELVAVYEEQGKWYA